MSVKLRFLLRDKDSFYKNYNVYYECGELVGIYTKLSQILGPLPIECPRKLKPFMLIFENGKLSLPALSKEDILKLHGKKVYDRQGRTLTIIGPSIETSNMVIVMDICAVLYSVSQHNLFFDEECLEPISNLE